MGFHQEILAAYKKDPVPDSPAIPAMLTDVTPVSDYPYYSLISVSGQVPYPAPDMRSHPAVYARGAVYCAYFLVFRGICAAFDGIRHRNPSYCAYPYPDLSLSEEV